MSVQGWMIPFTDTVQAVDTDMDFWEITPGAEHPVRIAGIIFGNSSDVGDAEEEGLRFTVRRLRATVTSGSGGAAATPENPQLANQVPTFTAEVNNTTVATTTGDNEVLGRFAWNVRSSPFEFWFPEPLWQPKAINGEVLVVRLETTVADDIVIDGTLFVIED